MQKKYFWFWGWALLLLAACNEQSGKDPFITDPCCNLATVPHGQRAFARFTLVNPESRPLLIRRIIVSCKCAYLELTAEGVHGTRRIATGDVNSGAKGMLLLQPGEKAHAVFRYETGERPPLAITLEEPVTFFLDHARVPRIDCHIKINISLPLRFSPPIPAFGTVTEAQQGTLLLHLFPLPGKPPVKVLGFKGTKEEFQAEVIKSIPEGVTIKFTAPRGLPPGYHYFPVRVLTDAGGGFELPLRLPIKIRPKLEIDPPPPLPLGSIVIGQERSVASTIKWYGQGEGVTMRILGNENLPPGLTANLVEKKIGRVWRIELAYKPGGQRPKPGLIRGNFRIVTSAPGYEKITIKFKGRFRR